MADTFFWYDYETFGRRPRRTRPAQVAGQRTTTDLELVGKPVMAYCKLSRDYLPEPEACLLTGITPQKVNSEGLTEEAFAARIQEELNVPGTCTVGYNANRFDHEVTRFLFYRTLRSPYEWHWKDGCTKWDLIDLARAAYALRPEGIEWAIRDDGHPSFRLEDLARANGIEHSGAHDARADVRATIALARRLKRAQPSLYDYYLNLRDKNEVRKLVDVERQAPLLHISSGYGSASANASLVAPIAEHPGNSNAVIVYDLRHDPRPAMTMTTDELREYLFAKTDDLPADVQRPALRRLRVNRCPFVARASIVDDDVAARIGLDVRTCRSHLEMLRDDGGFAARVRDACNEPQRRSDRDVDHALYDGFLEDGDRRTLRRLREMPPGKLVAATPEFADKRLPRLFYRYLARNHADFLADEMTEKWRRHCCEQLLGERGASGTSALAASPGAAGADETADYTHSLDPSASSYTLTLSAYQARVAALQEEREDPDHLKILGALERYGSELERWLNGKR